MLQLAEDSFQCCKDDLLKYIDNHGLLLMDIVWCEPSRHSLSAAQDPVISCR